MNYCRLASPARGSDQILAAIGGDGAAARGGLQLGSASQVDRAPRLVDDGDPSPARPAGAWPMGTTWWEKRNLARKIPIWDSPLCI